MNRTPPSARTTRRRTAAPTTTGGGSGRTAVRAQAPQGGPDGADARRTRVRRAVRAATRPGPWRRGPVVAALALLLGLLMLFHGRIPNGSGNPGSLVETFLPWCGAFVPVLLAAALWRRSACAVAVLLLPVVVWLDLFGGLLGDRSHPGGYLTVAEQNVDAGNRDPARTARDLAASGAHVLALVELTPQATRVYEKGLAKAYPFHTVQGTVGVWSTLPLSGTRPIDVMDYGPLAATKPLDLASNRALRTTVATGHGPLTVYAAHLGSTRVMPAGGFRTASRNIGVQALGRAVAADPGRRVVLLGDLNGTTDDRALAGITSQVRPVQEAAGDGFGFTWPAAFPVVRIDQILVRGVQPVSSRVLPATGSDHLPVTAAITW